jgi:hypothetical protein
MDRLTEIGIKYNTDKATGHGFTQFYSKYLEGYINPAILEIGIYEGASLKMWEEFYGYPLIVGVDIEDKKQFENSNIKTLVADQGKPEQLLKCLDICSEYDIIIDDGSHIIWHQISTLANMFPYLKSGGTYILEDLHTSFIHGQYNQNGDLLTAYDFLYRIGDRLEVETPYATPEQIQYLKDNVQTVEIFQLNGNDYMHSITSAITKR